MSQEISKRENAARAQISAVYGTPDDEFGATLFVSHHLDEIDASYWVEHTGQAKPDAQQVLQLLELRLDPEEDEIDILDFTLSADEMAEVYALARPDGRQLSPPGMAPDWDQA